MITLQGAKTPSGLNGAASGAIHWPTTLAQKRDAKLSAHHLRYKQRNAAGAPLHCLVLDCSASMLGHHNLSLAKGLLLDITQHLYQQRAWICVVAFGHNGARVVQSPQRVAQVHADWIAPISGGGGSPAAEAVLLADELLADYRKCFPHTVIELTMLSDGRFQLLPEVPLHADALHVIDFEQGALRLQRAELLAQNWGARYSHINDILPGQIQQATSTTRHNQ